MLQILNDYLGHDPIIDRPAAFVEQRRSRQSSPFDDTRLYQ
jgi:hypothetical protein